MSKVSKFSDINFDRALTHIKSKVTFHCAFVTPLINGAQSKVCQRLGKNAFTTFDPGQRYGSKPTFRAAGNSDSVDIRREHLLSMCHIFEAFALLQVRLRSRDNR